MRTLTTFHKVLAYALFAAILPLTLRAQQTVFNVPSADIMDKNVTYLEYDAVVGDTALSAANTPRTVHGIGHHLETGFNISSLNAPSAGSVALVSTAKWKFYDNSHYGLALFAGDHVYNPITMRTYTIGNYVYVAAAKTYRSTRITVGAYDFTAHTIDRANRAGIQAAVEQTVTPRLSFATDWYSGKTSAGYITSGIGYKVTPSITCLSAVQMGNSGLLAGNHSLLFIIGWTPSFHPGVR